jgi:hypothetical protein
MTLEIELKLWSGSQYLVLDNQMYQNRAELMKQPLRFKKSFSKPSIYFIYRVLKSSAFHACENVNDPKSLNCDFVQKKFNTVQTQ